MKIFPSPDINKLRAQQAALGGFSVDLEANGLMHLIEL